MVKVLQVEIPDRLREDVDALIREGWFADEVELVRCALQQLVRKRPFELQQRFQLEDIEWARQLHEERRGRQ